MERDKARIKPFCDQLAQLWENRCPDLRFGQIVSLLPAALRRSGRDPFCAEDEEMLEALGRVLSGEGTVCANSEETQLQELTARWESLIQGAGDGDFQTEEFHSLFLDTWQTLRETVTAWSMPPKAVALVASLGKFTGLSDYPLHTPPWEFDACGKFVEGLLRAVADPLRPRPDRDFYAGGLSVEPYAHGEVFLTPETFEAAFADLAQEYRREDYDGGYDFYEQEELPFPYEEEE